jgi:hypothetical protein
MSECKTPFFCTPPSPEERGLTLTHTPCTETLWCRQPGQGNTASEGNLHKKWLQQPGRALRKKDEPCPKQEKLVAVARLPYQGAASHKVSRLLAKYNIQTVLIPAKNIHLLRLAKDKLGLRTAGIYHIPCECRKVYVGQTRWTIEARLKEQRRHVRLKQPERSAVAEHSLTTYHHIDFDGASKLGTATRYMDHLVREAIEIRLRPDNFNRYVGFNLSHAWHPIIKMLQLPNSAPMANQGQTQVENQPRPPGHRRSLYNWPWRTLPYIRPWWWWPRWSSKRQYNTYT